MSGQISRISMTTTTTRGRKENPVIAEVIGMGKMIAGASGIIAKTGSGKGFSMPALFLQARMASRWALSRRGEKIRCQFPSLSIFV